MQKVSWLKDKIDEVFYPSSEDVLRNETDAYRQTFKYLLEALETFPADKPSLNIDADIGVFYNNPVPLEFISFDIVIMNNSRHKRGSSYRIGKDEFKPIVAFELLKGTANPESISQLEVLKSLGIREQYIFDPEYKYAPNGLIAFHLKENKLQEIVIKDSRVFSPALGLEIVDTGETLRLFNPETKSFLPTMEELTNQAAKVESLESENEKLKAELAKLKRQK